MRFADHADPTKANEWIEIQVYPQFAVNRQPIDPTDLDLNELFLAEIRLAGC